MTDLVEKIDDFAIAVGTDVGTLRRDVNLLRSKGGTEGQNTNIVVQQPEPIVPGLQGLALATSAANTSYGVDRWTGQVISGWQHVQQSIIVIMTTKIGSRLLRRWFGSEVPNLQDANGTRETFLMYYVAIAEALARFEPRYSLDDLKVTRAGADGVFHLELRGTYYPRGHLGDTSNGQQQFTRTALN